MRAVWYERFGHVAEALTVGELEDPRLSPREVLVRLRAISTASNHALGLEEIAKAHKLIEKSGSRRCVVIRP
jgi:NADPH:quinone reductase-like Zn-dependent oxidoreductase